MKPWSYGSHPYVIRPLVDVFYIAHLWQADNEMPQILEPVVHLNDYDKSFVGHWTKQLLVSDSLESIL